MRIITLHCDYIKFKVTKKAIREPEEDIPKEEVEVKEPLVVLTAVEKGDTKEQLNQMVEAVKKTASEVKAQSLVLYPYAHLYSNLAPPQQALEYLKEAESQLKSDFKIIRAPFGYYKSFELKCKGNPLSELSKEFKPASTSIISSKSVEEEYDSKKLLHQI